MTLTSYGRDGKPGGDGLDSDMIGVFQTKQADGTWADKLENWTVDPFGPDPKSARE